MAAWRPPTTRRKLVLITGKIGLEIVAANAKISEYGVLGSALPHGCTEHAVLKKKALVAC